MTPRDPCQAAGGCDRLPDLPAARLWVLERGGREAGPRRPWAPFGDLASLFSAFYFHRRGCKAGGRGVGRTRESTSSKSWLEDRWVSWAPNTGQAAPTEPLTSRVGLSFLTSDVAPGYRPQEVWHVGADASCPQLPPWAAGPPTPSRRRPLEPVQSYRRGQVAAGKAVNLTGSHPAGRSSPFPEKEVPLRPAGPGTTGLCELWGNRDGTPSGQSGVGSLSFLAEPGPLGPGPLATERRHE